MGDEGSGFSTCNRWAAGVFMRRGPIFFGGGGGGAICHSVTEGACQMGRASGESDVHFGADVGKWRAEGAGILVFFFLLKGENFLFDPICLYSKCSDFCGEFKCG